MRKLICLLSAVLMFSCPVYADTVVVDPSVGPVFAEQKETEPSFETADYGAYPELNNVRLDDDCKNYIWVRCHLNNSSVDPVQFYKLSIALMQTCSDGSFRCGVSENMNGETRYGLMMIGASDIVKFIDNNTIESFSDRYDLANNLEVGMTLLGNCVYNYGVSKDAVVNYFGFSNELTDAIWNNYMSI